MNWLEFVSSLIDAVVWPLCVITVIFLLKNQLKELIPALRNLKYKDFEVSFEKTMESIEENVETLVEPIGTSFANPVISEKFAYLFELTKTSPRSAIIESWLIVEEQLIRLSQTKLHDSANKTPQMILKELSMIGAINKELYKIIEDLRKIRNEAVHINKFYIHNYLIKDYIRTSMIVDNALRQID
ncbi:hypothetical protein [Paenibacillus amylolyticus]|uniref:DUF4145 domain-containing protein n=1 Tax=Paenibacillus amylolyticus TaxID=1451 RepID=A0A100VIC8_PAEAM|nr:hypothetical protein [Paenibacillus amylolyticus]GAS80361.1 unknown protein [Paenibacillus amylolyticus]